MISRRAMVAAGALAVAATQSRTTNAAVPTDLAPAGAGTLKALAESLRKTPRRRDFQSVPMILNSPDQWDHEALSNVLGYTAGPKQLWDHTDIAGPWLNLMRNSLNAQIWSYKNPDFLCVSGTHGSAHLALYDQATWDKYQLASFAGDKFKSNTLIEQPKAGFADAANFEDPEGVFSSADNAIPTLMRRGVVFLACHNAIAELGRQADQEKHQSRSSVVGAADRPADQSFDPGCCSYPRSRCNAAADAASRLPLRSVIVGRLI